MVEDGKSPASIAAVDAEEETEDEFDEVEDQVIDDLLWCVGKLYVAMQTAVSLGRVGHVQQLARAIIRLNCLVLEMQQVWDQCLAQG